MLKLFRVTNFKNYKDTVELSLETANQYDFNMAAVENNIVKHAIIYGENASGKTNIGYALFDIVIHLTDNNRKLQNYRLYKHMDCQNKPVVFHYEFLINGVSVIYDYEKVSCQVLLRESLKINGREVLNYDYERKCGYTRLAGSENLNINLSESGISIVKYVKNNAVLDNSVEENQVFIKFCQFVSNMLWFSSLEKNEYQGFQMGVESITDGIIHAGKVGDFEQFLRRAGIDCTLTVYEKDGEQHLGQRFENAVVDFFALASRGTCTVSLFYYWFIKMEKASLVFIDEFDAFYHSSLSRLIVEELKRLPNTQTILTTHNTDIMTNELLRPDCYFQIENNRIAAFDQLTEKDLREEHNLQRMYNAGAFYDRK